MNVCHVQCLVAERDVILQAWAKMEEAAGKLQTSVELLEHSLRKDPLSPYCLQALGSLEVGK